VQPQHKKKKPSATPQKTTPPTSLKTVVKSASSPSTAPVGQVETVLSALRQIQTQVAKQAQTTTNRPLPSVASKSPSETKKPGKISRFFFYLGLFFWWVLFRSVLTTFLTPRGVFDVKSGEALPIIASIFLFFTIVFFCRGTFRVWIAQIITGTSSFFLLVKPWLFPIIYSWQSSNGTIESFAYSYTSETHLFYVVPGMILAVVAFILSTSLANRMTK
jgi:hypothetical protein